MAAANPGVRALMLDINSPDAIRAFGQRMEAKLPALNVVVNKFDAAFQELNAAMASAVRQ